MKRLACAGALIALTSCGATDPYVFKAKEFDRTSEDFNQPIVDRDDVTICFNGWFTDDSEVVAMAEGACGEFGKNARASGKTYGECPLLTPHEAKFTCHVP